MKSPSTRSNENYGLSPENPVLVASNFASKIYLNKLMTLDGTLRFQRMGSRRISTYEKPIDIYEITRHGELFCQMYIYTHHHENIEEVAQEFAHKLKPRWDPSEKYALIERFFHDPEEYSDFVLREKELVKAHENGKCFARLKAEGDRLVYKLIWITNGKSVSGNVIPFPATEENLEKFNQGVKILAEQLRSYLETGTLDPLAFDQAFGDLTYVKRDIKFDYSNGKEPYRDLVAFNKRTGAQELIRIPNRRMRDTVPILYHKLVR